tara:strand:+ start:126 stop:659 length:534 start_codon:yes stop_codon:yes gene_type:complete
MTKYIDHGYKNRVKFLIVTGFFLMATSISIYTYHRGNIINNITTISSNNFDKNINELSVINKRIDSAQSRISMAARRATRGRARTLRLSSANEIENNAREIRNLAQDTILQIGEIQSNFNDLVEAYNRKIERVRESSISSKFGLDFWIGIVGIVSTLSGMVIAWRKDRREKQSDSTV